MSRGIGAIFILLVGRWLSKLMRAIVRKMLERSKVDPVLVTFLGHLPRSELLSWVKGCDIAVNASYSEGYSNSNVESMLLQRPLIATAVGGNLEQVVNGDTGCLVPAGDPEAMAAAVLRLYHDPGRRLAMGAAAAQRMRALHGVNEAVERHQAIYDHVLVAAKEADAR